MCHRDLSVLQEIDLWCTPFSQEVVLFTRIVESYRYDLKECAGIDLEQSLHEVFLGDQIEDLVAYFLPNFHFKVALGESSSE